MKSPVWLTFRLAALVAVLLIPGAPIPIAVLAQIGTPVLIRQANVPGMDDAKFPDVLGVGNTAYITASSGSETNRRSTLVSISQPFETSAFSGVADLGDSDGKSDYTNVVIAADLDG